MALWNVLGSNVVDGVTTFSVWAPNAIQVRMNDLEMTRFDNGIWKLELPQDLTGCHYSYNILTKDNVWITKFDPMSKSNEVHPNRRAIVYKDSYKWSDENWISKRKSFDKSKSKLSIYEMHINSWKHGSTYESLKDTLIPYLISMNFTHVQFLPITDHPFIPSWGYQVTGLYAPSAFWGSPNDLKSLINELHRNNIGVIFDLVTYHFPTDDYGLAKYDGSHLYEQGEVEDENIWRTLYFAWDRPEVRDFLLSSVRYWIEEYHFDGVRVDAVSGFIDKNSRSEEVFFDDIVPDEVGIAFMQDLSSIVHEYDGVFCIAEESRGIDGVTSDYPGIGFDYKYSMGIAWHFLVYYLKNQYDTNEHIYQHLVEQISQSIKNSYVWEISHDTVTHGTNGSLLSYLPGEEEFKMSVLESYLMFMYFMPGGKMVFMGTETGGKQPWDCQKSIEWDSPNIDRFSEAISKLNKIYVDNTSLSIDDNIKWVVNKDHSNRVFSLMRGDSWLIVLNFSENLLSNYSLDVEGQWTLIHSPDKSSSTELIDNKLNLAPGCAYWYKRLW